MVNVGELLKKLRNDEITIDEILNYFQTGEFNDVDRYDIREIIDKILPELVNDNERKILLNFLKDSPSIPPIRIIREFENEDNILEYMDLLTDEQKIKIGINNLKKDSSKKSIIEEIERKGAEDKKSKLLFLKASLSRKGFKEYFFRDDEIKHKSIGIDPDITYGVELETLGKASMDLLDVGEANGTTEDDKGQKRGFLLKRRKKWTFMDNCSRWKFNKWSRNRSCFSNT